VQTPADPEPVGRPSGDRVPPDSDGTASRGAIPDVAEPEVAEPNPDAVLVGSDDPDRTSQVTTPAAATSATTTPTTVRVRPREPAERWRPRGAAGGWSVMTSATP
jgi:hypothetical protein